MQGRGSRYSMYVQSLRGDPYRVRHLVYFTFVPYAFYFKIQGDKTSAPLIYIRCDIFIISLIPCSLIFFHFGPYTMIRSIGCLLKEFCIYPNKESANTLALKFLSTSSS